MTSWDEKKDLYSVTLFQYLEKDNKQIEMFDFVDSIIKSNSLSDLTEDVKNILCDAMKWKVELNFEKMKTI